MNETTIYQPLKAELPLIAIQTRDTLNFSSVVTHLTSRDLVVFSYENLPTLQKSTLYYMICRPKVTIEHTFNYKKMYDKFMAFDSQLILVNPSVINDAVFDAGIMTAPKDMMLELMETIAPDAEEAQTLMSALGGCTLKEATDFACLTMQRESSLTAGGLARTRKQYFSGSKGLTQVDTTLAYYNPPEALTEWLEAEKPYFVDGTDPTLTPRGLLMDGVPGVGKTEGAKYAANYLGVPLFRLDMAAAKGKYVGDSEAAIREALKIIDDEEPCIMLIDEVDKIAAGFSESSGVTASLFSQLLWWLAEHKSKVLTFMTVNNLSLLPKELYRPGRVDKVLNFPAMHLTAAVDFAIDFGEVYNTEFDKGDLTPILKKYMGGEDQISHAKVTEFVKAHVKATAQAEKPNLQLIANQSE